MPPTVLACTGLRWCDDEVRPTYTWSIYPRIARQEAKPQLLHYTADASGNRLEMTVAIVATVVRQL